MAHSFSEESDFYCWRVINVILTTLLVSSSFVLLLWFSSLEFLDATTAHFVKSGWPRLAALGLLLQSTVAVALFFYFNATVRYRVQELLRNARRVLDGEAVTVRRYKNSDEFYSLNALMYELGSRWTWQARTLQFDIEFDAIERERRRVAKELHDEILPSLARLIRSVQRGHETDNTLVDELHTAVAAFRDLLGELHPVDLEELGLVPALSNICGRYARLTGLYVVFIEETEECTLTHLQQLCLYRAMQAALRMFTDSDNDILLVTYDRLDENHIISVRCVDKKVSSAEWLSIEKHDFNAFESWCAMAGARVEIGASRTGEFPFDLIISIVEKPCDERGGIDGG